MKKRRNYIKLFEEVFYLVLIPIGIILQYCNYAKIAPTGENPICIMIGYTIAYVGFFGIAISFIGLGAFLETRSNITI